MSQTPNQKNIVHGSITAGGNVRIGDISDEYIRYNNNYFAAQEVQIPHRLTNNIPTNSDHILGRATELAQTKEHLAQHQATVLFNGIGGIGKTALASKYMTIYGSEYKHLAWITVQSTLAEAFTNNAPLLASLQMTLQVQDYIAAKQLDKAFEYLFHQLNLLERTLVVIDNANDLDDLDRYKNWFDTANCHFLITSRSQPSEWVTIEVDSLPEAEAVVLFRKLHPSVSATDKAIKNLLSKLFYHTLLIELVAKAGETAGIPFSDLQTMIETQFIHHQLLNEAPIPTGKHGSVVATNLKKAKIEDYIWLIFNQVKGLDNASKQLLKAMALLPVATPFDLNFLKEHFLFFDIPNSIVHLDMLVELGWLQREQDEEQRFNFKINPLIAKIVIQHLEINIDFAKRYFDSILESIDYNELNPNHNLFTKKNNKKFADRLLELFKNENTEEISELFDRIGKLEDYLGFYEKASKYLLRSLQIAETIFEKENSIISLRQSNLATVYSNLGQYEEASKLLELSLKSELKNFGNTHPNVAVRQSNLAYVYSSLGKYDQAIELSNEALKHDLQNFGENHPNIAVRKSILASIYTNLNRYDEAIYLLETSLESNLQNFGKDHIMVARSQANLANVYSALGQYDKAAALSETALNSNIRHFGKDHPEVSMSQNNLAKVYIELGRYDIAIDLLEKAINSILATLGSEHPNVKIFQSNLTLALNYKKEQERSGKIRINESRLLIVGQGGAGKTSLRTKLIDSKADLPKEELTTRGIDIEILPFKYGDEGDFILHIWDFGGQNIQHYAHQFFLSDSVVYALVHNEREQNEHLSYWLNIINLLGKNSPVLIVQNEKFGHSEDLRNIGSIRQNYPNVLQPIKLDLSKNDESLKKLKDKIFHLAYDLPHIGREYLFSFNEIRKELQSLALSKSYISWETFEEICNDKGIVDDELMKSYAQDLHRLGISLWFNNDIYLENYVFLKPKWIIDALFELIYKDEKKRLTSIINQHDVKSIWLGSEYKSMHSTLFSLMRKFDMCYEITGTNQVIIPQLLSSYKDTYIAKQNATRILFRYKFLPKGFITSLTCRLHTKIVKDKVWNDAVMFEDKNFATVFVREVYNEDSIECIAEGNGKADLLNEVISLIDTINTVAKYANLQVEKLVPCPCILCEKAKTPYYFKYERLKRKLLNNKTTIECEDSDIPVAIRDIMREVRVFTFQGIRDLVAADKLDEALSLLLSRYEENNAVIVQMADLNRQREENIKGTISRNEQNIARNHLISRFLDLVNVLEKENLR